MLSLSGRKGMDAFRAATFAAALCLSGGSYAQDQVDMTLPVVEITRIAESQAPIIDGYLDDPVWQTVPALDDFRQIEPVYGGEPSERTVLRLAYDDNNLYVSIYA